MKSWVEWAYWLQQRLLHDHVIIMKVGIDDAHDFVKIFFEDIKLKMSEFV